MTETSSGAIRIAVLIDCDNVSATHAAAVLEELAGYGISTVKRAYGDWTTNQLSGWKLELNRLALQPVQQFSYTTGKNSTDSALIIDAMDLLWTGNVDAFALVSSDSDFTRLATRLRESGKRVIGFGERKTPASLRNAVDQFVYLELLGDTTAEPSAAAVSAAPRPTGSGAASAGSAGTGTPGSAAAEPGDAAPGAGSGAPKTGTAGTRATEAGAAGVNAAWAQATGTSTGRSRRRASSGGNGAEETTSSAEAVPAAAAAAADLDEAPRINLESALVKAVNATSGDDGWASLSRVGQHLSRAHVDFDPRDFGHQKLSTLVAEQPYLAHRTEDRHMQVALKGRPGRR